MAKKRAKRRFAWSKATYEESCLELKSRGLTQTLSVDPGIPCLVRGCRETPVSGDICYRPSKHANTQNNRIIGHKDCVDAICAKLDAESYISPIAKVTVSAPSKAAKSAQAKAAAHAPAKSPEARARVPKPKFQVTIQTSAIDALRSLSSSDLLKRIEVGLADTSLGKKAEQEAYERGYTDALAKIAVILQERGIDI